MPILNGHRAELLDLPRLSVQLCGLERRTARGGRDSIDHGPGAHDDVANAVAGVLVRTVGEIGDMEVWARLGRMGEPAPAVVSRLRPRRWESRFDHGRIRNWDRVHDCWFGEHPSHKERLK